MNQSSHHKHLPDFVIVGAMKSATTTLQEQLALQAGIFMSEPKEPNFFSDDDQYRKGMPWYAGLFNSAKSGDLLGEASTHYTKLPTHPNAIRRMHEHLPDARLIYVMRHPTDRLVSHYIHEWSMGNIDSGIDEAVCKHPEMIEYGKYAMQLDALFAVYGRRAVLPVFFDRLIRDPQSELERVCRFIGYTGVPIWHSDLAPSNISAERVRKFPLYSLLVESAPATFLRRAIVPKKWRERVRHGLAIRQRPVLDPDLKAKLESEFDRDLARLGEWLGISLSCGNFKQATTTRALEWVAADE